jgi:hypothetical protein
MKTIADLIEHFEQGNRPAVEFKKDILECECYAEPLMRARLVGVRDDGDDVVILSFEFSEFDAHNLEFEVKSWFDEAGKPTLTAREAGQYKPVDDLYLMTTDLTERWLSLLPADSLTLYQSFKESGGTSYRAWLEAELTAANLKLNA